MNSPTEHDVKHQIEFDGWILDMTFTIEYDYIVEESECHGIHNNVTSEANIIKWELNCSSEGIDINELGSFIRYNENEITNELIEKL